MDYVSMGGRLVGGVARFRVWAPSAKNVTVVGDFGEVALTKKDEFWEGECAASVGDLYHFLVDGKEKCDPYGLSGEMRPGWRSRLVEMPKKVEWKRKRSEAINIYEVHLGSWSCDGMVFRGYVEIAHELAEYCKKLGYTHVEVMPVMAHQFDESWGYQVTGYFATSSRFGYPGDLQEFVKVLHEAGIGVIFDWVPAHFPKNEKALAKFDGTALYEYGDPRRGEHPEWETLVFDFGKEKVCDFLINSAIYWFERMGVDGLRIDAVYSMLYHSYMRQDGEWLPNKDGGHENYEAIAFLKKLNRTVHEKFPGALMIAEDSSLYRGVTDPNGLGFDYKWNVGWSHHIYKLLLAPYEKREELHGELLYPLEFAHQDRHISVLSHDDAHGWRGSFFEKMPGDDAEKFANVKLLLGMLFTYPGKKLTFMGTEFATKTAWNCKAGLNFSELDDPGHQGVQNFAAALGKVYSQLPELQQDACEVAVDESGTVGLLRGKNILAIHRYLPGEFSLPDGEILLSSNAKEFDGSGILGKDVSTTILRING